MSYKPWTLEQKQEYGKKFSAKERSAYRKGVRNGWLRRHHDKSGKYDTKRRGSGFATHTFTKEELNGLFDDLDNVKLT